MFRNILIAAALLVAAPAYAQQVERGNASQSLNAASSGGASGSVAEVRRKWEGVVEVFVRWDQLERREPASLDDQNCFMSPSWTQSRCPRCKERNP